MTNTSAENAIVRLEDVHLSFGQTQVLKGIDLTVNKGDAVSLSLIHI